MQPIHWTHGTIHWTHATHTLDQCNQYIGPMQPIHWTHATPTLAPVGNSWLLCRRIREAYKSFVGWFPYSISGKCVCFCMESHFWPLESLLRYSHTQVTTGVNRGFTSSALAVSDLSAFIKVLDPWPENIAQKWALILLQNSPTHVLGLCRRSCWGAYEALQCLGV